MYESVFPPDLDRLLVVRHWLALALKEADARITQLRAEQAARQRTVPPPEPDYRIQRSPGADRAPTAVHIGSCGMGRKAPGVSADTARRALADGIPPCEVCRPESELGILDV
ncbi:DUF6233 domain-containing protein [Streptomyces sp. DH12]|uniref:DUF6233 domain-containing protein n=1 Tax=Streptomyces sp. DH12 TaxID=2857010 RepID=UPI001E5837A6|nr:DUF6233 domain-containing protein [Streptomyces sp. DH12]